MGQRPPDQPEERVRWVYAAGDADQLAERYDQWSDSYESDLTRVFDYVAPQRAVERFVAHVPPAARVLDVGAGTGLVGVLLAERGYGDIEALDLSAGMLAQAEEKGVYRALHQMRLGEPLGFPDDRFDAAIGVGVFTEGHAPPAALPELARIVRRGGMLVFTVRADLLEAGGFRAVFDGLLASGVWRQVEAGEPWPAMPKIEPDVLLQTWVFEVA